MSSTAPALLTVAETGRRLGVSTSTVWRMIRRGAVRSVRQRGRRLIPEDAVVKQRRSSSVEDLPPFTLDNPIFRLVGAYRSGGRGPGASDKHAILDE